MDRVEAVFMVDSTDEGQVCPAAAAGRRVCCQGSKETRAEGSSDIATISFC